MVLTDPIDLAHALNPTNDSERLLFRQFAPTLVRLDCQGRVRPGLAESWTAEADGRGWTFTLRDGARFPEGTPLTALHVAGTLMLPDARALGIESAVELDDRRVRVRLREARDTVPSLFANPTLAVISGLASEPGSLSRIDLPSAEGRPPIVYQLVQNGDPRDALDRGADLLVTRDPAVVDYAASRLEFAAYPLPWDRTYVLIQPAGAEPVTIAGDSVRRSLARDAVRAEARPAEPPFWWDSLPVVSGTQEPRLSSFRIVYPRTDEVARGLAERIVALSGSGTQLRAAALGQSEFAAALRDGTEGAYVLPVPRQTLVPVRDAPWPSGASIQPLIDTRARAILRRGSPALAVDWDGTVRVLGDDVSSRELP